uniref:Uncharacterized protein n=1 Tax=Anguilla anguilla TaxID=7936 RepID=A0A0E9WT98_ANGAN
MWLADDVTHDLTIKDLCPQFPFPPEWESKMNLVRLQSQDTGDRTTLLFYLQMDFLKAK